MSYEVNVLFAQADRIEDGLAIARTFVRAICTSAYMAKRIADNRYFIPSVKYNATPANRDFAKIADRYWLYSLFNFQFLYWPQHHLLGAVMEDDKDLLKAWPNGQAEVVSVFFQDGNDRNYDFEEWPETIEFFRERTGRYRPIVSMPKKQALAALEKVSGELFDEEEYTGRAVDYIVKTALYDKVFEDLKLTDFLYERDSGVFERFALNGIQTMDLIWELYASLTKISNRMLSHMDDKDYVFVPVVISETGATFLFQQEIKRGEKLTDEQVQATIRKAADEFLRYTDAGKVLQHNFKNRLTYQEVLCCMPAAWLKKYGLQLIQRNTYSNAVLL